MAALNGHLDVVKLLLKKGCDVNSKNKDGDNAFTLAAFEGMEYPKNQTCDIKDIY